MSATVPETLERFEQHLADRVVSYRGPAVVSDMLSYHFGYGAYGPARRGKRLRPRIVMGVAVRAGGASERALDAASAIEILHNYSLVHDDIEDGDELRHGRTTLWRKYGIAQAINAGDAMCALSFLTLARAKASHSYQRVVAMIESLHEAHRVMCNGQSLDLSFETAAHVEPAQYEEMIACKTAALFEAACTLGAHCAGADAPTIERFARAGRAYGMAFQIQDDVDGVWASEGATGKTAAADIARRKWTFPVVWALSQPPSDDRETIAAAYREGSPLGTTDVVRIVAALERVGAKTAALSRIETYRRDVVAHSDGDLRELLLGTIRAEFHA